MQTGVLAASASGWILVGLGIVVQVTWAQGTPQAPVPPSGSQDTSRLVTEAREPPSVAQSLESLDALLTRYQQSLATPPGSPVPPGPPATARAQQALGRLRGLSTKWPAQSPLDYRANLDRQVRDLLALLHPKDQTRSAAVLEVLAEDLEAKLEHCVKSGGRLGGSVTVNVRTLRGGQEVRDWQVFYLPRVLEALGAGRADRFPRLSSPTNDLLVPGRYVMWSSDPSSGRQSEKTVIKVGEGRKDLTIDLTVPAS